MSAEPIQPTDIEISVSEARAQLADLVDQAEDGKVIYISRHGRRVAAITPPNLPAEAASEHRLIDEISRRIVAEDAELLRRLG